MDSIKPQAFSTNDLPPARHPARALIPPSLSSSGSKLALVVMGLLLAACDKTTPRPPPPIAMDGAVPATSAAARAAAAASPSISVRTVRNVDDYKVLVAEQIRLANPASDYSGKLPPILPAIVVVNISIDEDGALNRVVVQRSRNSAASKAALGAVRRVDQPFPKPKHLLPRGHKTLDFAETFLFVDADRFQLRTLASPQ
jgi:protein TonB